MARENFKLPYTVGCEKSNCKIFFLHFHISTQSYSNIFVCMDNTQYEMVYSLFVPYMDGNKHNKCYNGDTYFGAKGTSEVAMHSRLMCLRRIQKSKG